MKEILQMMRQNKLLIIWPIVVFIVMLAIAAWIVTRPILGTAVYRP
jgi:hypothetical protein